MVTEIGQVVVAVILSTGMVALVLLGKPVDGIAPGFLAVLGFLYGGAVVKSTAARAAINAGQTAVNAIGAAAASTQGVPNSAATPAPPPQPPADHVL
ncbi:MAG: hypothetical protein KGO96_13870 [Elusimicrobia bacterium]|nr:hypothetical protein [Elusimicrobiota bacterium]